MIFVEVPRQERPDLPPWTLGDGAQCEAFIVVEDRTYYCTRAEHGVELHAAHDLDDQVVAIWDSVPPERS